MKRKLVSIIIRTFNEQRYLNELLETIKHQKNNLYDIEIIIVDSGSTDSTLIIAQFYECRILHIKKEEFTFGRSLNIGCGGALGSFLVFISGHCIPVNSDWLESLIKPLETNLVSYVYGRQEGRDFSKFSEKQLFSKYFTENTNIPQKGFFCNNANAALKKEVWDSFKFNEHLSGLEDMYLAKQLCENGHSVGYIAKASVYHIHDENWSQVRNRYEREAIAMQKIMPELHFDWKDFLKCLSVGVIKDLRLALRQKVFFKEFISILRFRYAQYAGVYIGNHMHRKLSHEMKMKYFYPRVSNLESSNDR